MIFAKIVGTVVGTKKNDNLVGTRYQLVRLCNYRAEEGSGYLVAFVGVGPGDPGLVTQKAIAVLNRVRVIFAPRVRGSEGSLALNIVKDHIRHIETKKVEIIDYAPSGSPEKRKGYWRKIASDLIHYLHDGRSVAYVTIGDPSVFSTYTYLVKALRELDQDVGVVTVPGISSYTLAASLVNQPLAEGNEEFLVCPAAAGLERISEALDVCGNVVIMKIGKRIEEIIKLIREKDLLSRAVFVARAGLEGERVEADLSQLGQGGRDEGNLSVILVKREGK
jgi:precorrin-2/cobalt-factor-2 C20-methyltransferase